MLGSALSTSIKRHNVEVIDTDIRSEKNPLDITKPDDVSDFIKDIKPDVVIHTAAYTDVDGCELNLNKANLINTEGTQNVAKACKDTGAFVLYISTDFIFDGKKRTPYTEDDKPSPINEYGRSKLQGEDFIKKILDKYLIIRTSWMYGKSGKNFVDTIIDKAESSELLQVVDDQKGSPTYAVDLSNAIVNLISLSINLYPLTLNVTNSGNCTWYEFAEEIIRIKGIKNVKIEPITSDKSKRVAERPKMSVLDNSKFIKISGKSLPSWRDALTRYLKGT